MDSLYEATPSSEVDVSELIERSIGRARDALAVVEAIDLGELFVETPASAAGRRRHEIGVALLDILWRELSALLEDMAAANPI